MINVTIFGDSISKGLFLDGNKIVKLPMSYVDILEKKLNINIQNISFFGQTSKRFIDKKFLNDFLNKLKKSDKNIVIINLGGNDSDYDFKCVSEKPYDKHTSINKLSNFKKCMVSIIKKLIKNNCIVFVCSLFPISSERYFNNILAKKYDKNNILKFLNYDLTNIFRTQQVYNDELLKICNRLEVDFIDYRCKLMLKKDMQKYLSSDGIHANILGQKFIANYIIKSISNSLT